MLKNLKQSKDPGEKGWPIKTMKSFLTEISKEDLIINKISLKIRYLRTLNIVQKGSLKLDKVDFKVTQAMELTIFEKKEM